MKVVPEALLALGSQATFKNFHGGCDPKFFTHLKRFLIMRQWTRYD